MRCTRMQFLIAGFTMILGWSSPARAEGSITYIPSEAVAQMLEFTTVVFIDVRGHTSYEAEHIKGARDFSLIQLRMGQYPVVASDATIVTYCGCPHAMAVEAAELLVAKGYPKVAVLDDGYYAWKDRGLPIEKGASADTLRKYQIDGMVVDRALFGKQIQVFEPATGQREQGFVDDHGRFALHLPFYGRSDGLRLTVLAGQRSWQLPVADHRDLTLP